MAGALLLGGCGGTASTPHVPRPRNRIEQIETACADLQRRLAEIDASTAGLREPQPAGLVGRQLPERLEGAVKEAVAALYKASAALEAASAPYVTVLAVSQAIEAYDRFSQTLPRSDPRTPSAGLHLGHSYEAIGDHVSKACASVI